MSRPVDLRHALLVVLALLAPVLVAAPASAAEDRTQRLAGATREATAVEIADTSYPDGAEIAILARSDDFADALAATALAGQAHAPILLTPPDQLAGVTADALDRLGVARVWIVGGEGAVSADVAAQLQAQYEVTRIEGADRYATAAAVATKLTQDYGSDDRPRTERTVFLARGDQPWDAMSLGAPAAASDDPMPLLLTHPTQLPAPTLEALRAFDPGTVVVAGGQTAVGAGVVRTIEAELDASVRRVAGEDRYATSAAIADYALERQSFGAEEVVATRGDAWADALTAAPYAGNQYAPLLAIGTPVQIAPAARQWLLANCGAAEVVTLIGGSDALTETVAGQAERAAECTQPGDGDDLLERGERGPAVQDKQEQLADLGYWVGPIDGVYGKLTEQAVMAFQKVNGLQRDGIVGPAVRDAMTDPRTPQARSSSGYWVEVDEARQVLKLVRDGVVTQVFNTSTGTEDTYTHEGQEYVADTPNGQWEIYRQVDGWRESHLGRLWRPKYFHTDGIAVHGYENVPPYPASHGCVRVTIEAMNHLWETGALPIGTNVWVY